MNLTSAFILQDSKISLHDDDRYQVYHYVIMGKITGSLHYYDFGVMQIMYCPAQIPVFMPEMQIAFHGCALTSIMKLPWALRVGKIYCALNNSKKIS